MLFRSGDVTMPLWLLRHADVAQHARVRALAAWLADRVGPLQDAMVEEGEVRVWTRE